MINQILTHFRRHAVGAMLAVGVALSGAPIAAQGIQTVDPDSVIDGDLTQPQPSGPIVYDGISSDPAPVSPSNSAPEYTYPAVSTAVPSTADRQTAVASQGDTWKEDDLIGAAEGVFGKGAEGLAGLIEDVLSKQGEPNAYIVGREAGGAFILGARYGSGTLYHKVEGQRPVYWTGPSVGFDVGANAGSTFVLVYNLYDTEQLYERYPAGEGTAYLVGGFNASYLRKGNVVLIPIRVGAGLRLGVNAGYMKFSEKQRWLPF